MCRLNKIYGFLVFSFYNLIFVCGCLYMCVCMCCFKLFMNLILKVRFRIVIFFKIEVKLRLNGGLKKKFLI